MFIKCSNIYLVALGVAHSIMATIHQNFIHMLQAHWSGFPSKGTCQTTNQFFLWILTLVTWRWPSGTMSERKCEALSGLRVARVWQAPVMTTGSVSQYHCTLEPMSCIFPSLIFRWLFVISHLTSLTWVMAPWYFILCRVYSQTGLNWCVWGKLQTKSSSHWGSEGRWALDSDILAPLS